MTGLLEERQSNPVTGCDAGMDVWTVDLHNHTPLFNDYRGDPSTTPSEILEAARAAGVDLLAVTDHLSLAYFPRLRQAAEDQEVNSGRPVTLLPGIELHLLAEQAEAHLVVLLPEDGLEERATELFCRISFSPAALPFDQMAAHLLPRDPQFVAVQAAAVGGLVHLAHVDRYFGPGEVREGPRVYFGWWMVGAVNPGRVLSPGGSAAAMAQVITPLVVAVLVLLFWMWMFSDMTHNTELSPESRTLWFLAFIFTNFFAASYYYVSVYRNR